MSVILGKMTFLGLFLSKKASKPLSAFFLLFFLLGLGLPPLHSLAFSISSSLIYDCLSYISFRLG
jgi:hypothetical protein